MVECPSCKQVIDEEFGMITCPQCEHVFMVDVEGLILQADDSPAVGGESPAAGDDASEIMYALNEDAFSEEPAIEEGELPLDGGEDVGYDSPLEELITPSEFSEDAELVSEFETPQSDPQEFGEELSDFADSDSSVPPQGPYEYLIHVRSVSAQEILQKLRKALVEVGLEERQCSWNPSTEEALLPWMGPVTASRLVARLRLLPVQLTWRQRHYLKEED